ncbi:DNA-binding MarR family transcriptional regulator [Paenibacillus cellulosilyticus]|uniref:DNA-binding MarR family transcriptional regulator n=1 Tax=Paenibacillus cellulosilyticus TaxID=375489 RepID=A0A2V2YGV0_9BACL|nr:MarR family transcriptional regulator [Paenibacillus cellulosilyticus]PWV92056.1 DNA-binding MarR family transcriptional regulator [Paenibacillus cellulosilyticus]QKS46737.1 MarR family transcriptional regulator [Paenibacillus cellulosilyticus]
MEKNDTIQELHDAFLRFSKAEWRQQPVRGYKRSELRVLFCVMEGMKDGRHGVKLSEISKRLMVTPPSVTQLMKTLIEDQLVERTIDPEDKRSFDLVLTPKGMQIAQEADEHFKQSLGGLVEHLGEEQSQQLADLLTKAFYYYADRSRNL